jgi:hypothetical protein
MQNYLHDVDEIDVLYARMERDPAPLGLLERVYLGIAERARRRRRIGYWVMATSLLLAASLAFFLGQQARMSGALILVDLLLANGDLLMEAPTEWVASLAELMPLPVIVPVVASVGLVGVAAQLALTPVRRLAARGMGR